MTVHTRTQDSLMFNRPGSVRWDGLLPEIPASCALRRLPQFFRADLAMVRKLGGEVYRAFLDAVALEPRFRFATVDSRVQMLMPGFWACMPGWHCDDFHRPRGRQPDLRGIARQAPSVHVMTIVGCTALTEFVDQPIELPGPEALVPRFAREPVYSMYDRLIDARAPRTRRMRSGELVRFGPLDFHRGTQAVRRGWRLFIRLTQSDHVRPRNERRTQTQVYLTEPTRGW